MVGLAAADAMFNEGVAGAATRLRSGGLRRVVLGRGFGEGFGHHGVDEPARREGEAVQGGEMGVVHVRDHHELHAGVELVAVILIAPADARPLRGSGPVPRRTARWQRTSPSTSRHHRRARWRAGSYRRCAPSGSGDRLPPLGSTTVDAAAQLERGTPGGRAAGQEQVLSRPPPPHPRPGPGRRARPAIGAEPGPPGRSVRVAGGRPGARRRRRRTGMVELVRGWPCLDGAVSSALLPCGSPVGTIVGPGVTGGSRSAGVPR